MSRDVLNESRADRNKLLDKWFSHMKEVCAAGHVFEYPRNAPPYPKSKITVLPPIVDVDTTSYADILVFLNKAFVWRNTHKYAILLMFGDEQFVDRIWKVRCADPANWYWLIPFPGEFHFCLHIVHAVYRLHPRLLMDIAAFMERDKVKVEFLSKHFHKQEDFLLLVFESIHHWFGTVANKPENFTVLQLLNACQRNKSVHELLYMFFYFGTFYINLRQNIRNGLTNAVSQAWLYAWPMFHSTRKSLYAQLCLLSSYITNFAHPAVREKLHSRLANLRGVPGHCIGTDMVTEKVCVCFLVIVM